MEFVQIIIAAVVALACTGALVATMTRSLRAGVWAVAGMMFLVGLVADIKGGQRYTTSWIGPVQTYRAELCLALSLILWFGVLAHFGRLSYRVLGGPVLWLMLIQFYSGVLRCFFETPEEGLKTIAFAIAVQVPLALAAFNMLKGPGDSLRLVRSLGFGGAMWLGAVSVQYALNRGVLMSYWGDRFVGLSGNPQQCTVYVAPLSVVALWLVMNDPRRGLKLVWSVVGAAAVLATIMTGSRMGALMFVVGATAVLYARMGRAVILLPLVVGAAYGMLSLVESLDLTRGLSRLTSGADTRSEAWAALLREAIDHPLFGSPATTRFTENSYLMGVASYGIGMGLIMLALMATSVYQMMRLWRVRHWLDAGQRRLVDLILGYTTLYFLGGIFEWYILARLDAMLVLFLVFAGIATHLLGVANANAAAAHLHPLDSGGEPEEQPVDSSAAGVCLS